MRIIKSTVADTAVMDRMMHTQNKLKDYVGVDLQIKGILLFEDDVEINGNTRTNNVISLQVVDLVTGMETEISGTSKIVYKWGEEVISKFGDDLNHGFDLKIRLASKTSNAGFNYLLVNLLNGD